MTAIILGLDVMLYMYVYIYIYICVCVCVYDILGNGKKWTTIYRFLMKCLTKMIIMYRFVVSCISVSLVKSVVRIRNKVFVPCIDLLIEI